MMQHNSPGYSVTVRMNYPDQVASLGRITSVIGQANASIGAIDVVDSVRGRITRDITINVSGEDHGREVVELLKTIDQLEIVHVSDRVFLLHLGGKLEVNSRVPVKTRDDLSMAYTPGVARVCRAIAEQPDSAFTLTIRRNTVAVVSDGSAVLGLGNIGPKAAMPVMEGKAVLFKEFAGVDAFPLCLDTQDADEIVRIVKAVAPGFGGINLEDISAPRCTEIEQRLIEELDIPVFHDDQHGTAIVVLAAMRNALAILNKPVDTCRIVINGAGAAGAAIAELFRAVGTENIVICDSTGAINRQRDNLSAPKQSLATWTNPEQRSGTLSDVIEGADVFIGVSVKDALKVDDVRRMADDPIVFALANPDPEIAPESIVEDAAIIATGRSDYPNQINNVLCFPGLFRGVLDVRARRIDRAMKVAAADAIAEIIEPHERNSEYIIPSVFDRRVAENVAKAVAAAAIESGLARKT